MPENYDRLNFHKKLHYKNEDSSKSSAAEELFPHVIKMQLEKHNNELIDRELAESLPLPEHLAVFAHNAKQWLTERNNRLGITKEPVWSQYSRYARYDGSGFGDTNLNLVRIVDLSSEEIQVKKESADGYLPVEIPVEVLEGCTREEAARLVRAFLEARTLVHELYHDSGRQIGSYKLGADGSPEKLLNEIQGLVYVDHLEASSGAGDGPALEEGLAITVEKEASDSLVRKTFPEGAKIYDNLVRYALSKYADSIPESLITEFHVKNFDGDRARYGFTPYYSSYVLVNYLREKVPNFDSLVEQARLNSHSLGLARAIKDKYGVGVSKVLMQLRNHSASEVCKSLQALDKLNN